MSLRTDPVELLVSCFRSRVSDRLAWSIPVAIGKRMTSLKSGRQAFLRELFAHGEYHGPVSDHFDGRHFHNLDRPQAHHFAAYLRWRLRRLLGVGRWSRWTDALPGSPPPARVSGQRLRVTFINHATVLLQTNDLNLLTDPIWSTRASPVSWAGPRRRRPPGLRFEDLPAIDVVLLSHNHYDHLDLPTLRRLAHERAPRFVVGLGNGRLLEAHGIGPVMELDWGQAVEAGGNRVTAVTAVHFSARGLNDRNTTLWCGYVIEGPGGPVYFAGDTGQGDHFQEIKRRFGAPRLALLPIGASKPRWFMAPVHLSPHEAVQVHQVLGATTSMAIHFGTFPMADDGEHEPVIELNAALAAAAPARPLWVLAPGEGRDVP